jgi:hypothetical protein
LLTIFLDTLVWDNTTPQAAGYYIHGCSIKSHIFDKYYRSVPSTFIGDNKNNLDIQSLICHRNNQAVSLDKEGSEKERLKCQKSQKR